MEGVIPWLWSLEFSMSLLKMNFVKSTPCMVVNLCLCLLSCATSKLEFCLGHWLRHSRRMTLLSKRTDKAREWTLYLKTDEGIKDAALRKLYDHIVFNWFCSASCTQEYQDSEVKSSSGGVFQISALQIFTGIKEKCLSRTKNWQENNVDTNNLRFLSKTATMPWIR